MYIYHLLTSLAAAVNVVNTIGFVFLLPIIGLLKGDGVSGCGGWGIEGERGVVIIIQG